MALALCYRGIAIAASGFRGRDPGFRSYLIHVLFPLLEGAGTRGLGVGEAAARWAMVRVAEACG
eukprot:31790-Amorphochlora_amoeboformis.AAC.1